MDGARSGAGTPFEFPEAVGYNRAPYASLVANNGGLTAGPLGVAMGIFAWADPVLGQVSNAFSAGAQLGFVLPTFVGWSWQRVYIACVLGAPPSAVITFPFPMRILRAGFPVVLAAVGNFITRFVQGGQAGSRVWVDPATGLAYSNSNGGTYKSTPWTLMQSGGCNANLQISSFAQPFLNLS